LRYVFKYIARQEDLMKACAQDVRWQAALLRGVVSAPQGLELLVSLSARQFLRFPVAGAASVWEQRIGHRVWVDLARWKLATDLPVKLEPRHD
jgi:hypothetical protein